MLVLPSNLTRKVAGEENTIEEFFRREIKRVDYFQQRFVIRDEESRKKKVEEVEDTDDNKEVISLILAILMNIGQQC